MKFTYIMILLVSLNTATKSQAALKYEEVVHLDSSINSSTLFIRANNWIVDIFENPNKVIQLIDRDSKQIVCKATMPFKSKYYGGSARVNGFIDFTIKLFFKEGRYKYILTDFIHNPADGHSFGLLNNNEEYSGKIPLTIKKWRNNNWVYMKLVARDYSETIIRSLNEHMKKENELENDDW